MSWPRMRAAGKAGDVFSHRCDKAFFVSPFIDMRGTYHFRGKPPGERAVGAGDPRDRFEEGCFFVASHTGKTSTV